MTVQENTALLDKVVFNNIRIKGFTNMDELARRGILEVNEKSQVRYITESGQEFTRLQIKDDEVIDQLKAGTLVTKNERQDWCKVELSIKDRETANLRCYTVEQYADYLQQIEDRLMCHYGIDADFSDVQIEKLEINRTFKLDAPFETYHRPIMVIMNNLSGYFKGQMEFMKKDDNLRKTETYYARTSKNSKSKCYAEFKIYNKSKDVARVIVLKDDYMRVELKLVGSEKIKRSLGTNRFSGITDEIINTYFDEQMQKLIIKPYEKWQKKRDKYIVVLMKEQMQKNMAHWKVNTLRTLQNDEIKNRCPVLLDVSEIIPLVNEVVREKDQRYKAKKTFRNQAEKIENIFCNNDHLKLAEIIAKLQIKNRSEKATVN